MQSIRTPKTREDFLFALAESGNVGKACAAAGIGRQTAYDWREADKDFAAAWDRAQTIATSLLEDESFRRAHDGVDKPVYQNGSLVGTIREYSDTLMIFLLKARDKKYRDANRATEPDAYTSGVASAEDAVRKLAALLAPGRADESARDTIVSALGSDERPTTGGNS